MDSINIFLISILSIIYARLLKSTVNWLKVDGFTISNKDLKLELFCLMATFSLIVYNSYLSMLSIPSSFSIYN